MTILEALEKTGKARLPAWTDDYVIYEYGKLWLPDGREYKVTDNYLAGVLSRDWISFEDGK